jgi:hypothetical protein
MKLSIKQRLILINLLPKKGDFVLLTVKQDLYDKIKISQEDIKLAEIKSTEKGLSWNTEKDFEIEIEISELEHEMVKTILKKLDEEKELTDDTVDLYKLFI